MAEIPKIERLQSSVILAEDKLKVHRKQLDVLQTEVLNARSERFNNLEYAIRSNKEEYVKRISKYGVVEEKLGESVTIKRKDGVVDVVLNLEEGWQVASTSGVEKNAILEICHTVRKFFEEFVK